MSLLGKQTINAVIDGRTIAYEVTVSNFMQKCDDNGEPVGQPIKISTIQPGADFLIETSKGTKMFFSKEALKKVIARDYSSYHGVVLEDSTEF